MKHHINCKYGTRKFEDRGSHNNPQFVDMGWNECTCLSWENKIDEIWSKAYIPKYADDAKIAIKDLVRDILEEQKKLQ